MGPSQGSSGRAAAQARGGKEGGQKHKANDTQLKRWCDTLTKTVQDHEPPQRMMDGLELRQEPPDGKAGEPGVHLSQHTDKRTAFSLAASVGHRAEAQLASNGGVCGVLLSVYKPHDVSDSSASSFFITLRAVRVMHDEHGQPTRSSTVHPYAIVPMAKLRCLSVRDVELSNVAVGIARAQQEQQQQQGCGNSGVERELVQWDSSSSADPAVATKLDSKSAAQQQWDQFEANKAKFGVESTFDERKYTTELDRSSASISESEAARIAHEIEQNGTYANHAAATEAAGEEADFNEEEAFSAVQSKEESATLEHTPPSASVSATVPEKAWEGTQETNGKESSDKESPPSTSKFGKLGKLNPNAKAFTPSGTKSTSKVASASNQNNNNNPHQQQQLLHRMQQQHLPAQQLAMAQQQFNGYMAYVPQMATLMANPYMMGMYPQHPVTPQQMFLDPQMLQQAQQQQQLQGSTQQYKQAASSQQNQKSQH